MSKIEKYWERMYSECISEYIKCNPGKTAEEIRQALYFSPETEAGQIWNALVLKLTTT